MSWFDDFINTDEVGNYQRERLGKTKLVYFDDSLVKLTHETVGAVIVAQQVGRSTRTQYVAGDDVGKQFQKRRFDDRLGWQETTVPRRAVRDELITQLTRSPLTPAERSSERAASEPDTFVVKSVRELRTP